MARIGRQIRQMVLQTAGHNKNDHTTQSTVLACKSNTTLLHVSKVVRPKLYRPYRLHQPSIRKPVNSIGGPQMI